ncbi:hypothetical protein ACQCX5_08885 [Propionibacteriaceae bacterium G57]|uniref:hypothetical protein n=1 Tax=Aestuariimicrobium sp. G57 TaxID=3418485 RepID=UPI003DA72C26
MQTPEAFVVGYSPVPAAGRVARAESLMRRAGLSVVIYIVITAGLYWWLRDQLSLWQVLLGGIPSAALVLAFVIWRWVELRAARKSLGRVPAGEAVRIDHRGVRVGDGTSDPIWFEWPAMSDIAVAGRKIGAGPDLIVNGTFPNGGGHQTWKVPISYLDTLPGTIDSAVRAYSGGRQGLDMSGMDSIFGD